MVTIPAGLVKAGMPPEKIHVGPFLIDKTEVTQKHYEEVMGTHRFSLKGDDHPAEQVSWFKAKEYCEKIGKRLPTEHEWEQAARGGSDSRYFWGTRPDASYSWYAGHPDIGHKPVGQKKPNAFGLFDTAGNVWEWTSTEVVEQSNYSGELLEKKVAKGGAYNVSANLISSSSRLVLYPKNRSFNIGFRCAK